MLGRRRSKNLHSRSVTKESVNRQSGRDLLAGVLHDSIIYVTRRFADEDSYEPIRQIDAISDRSILCLDSWTDFILCIPVAQIRWKTVELFGRKQDFQSSDGTIQSEDGHGI